MAIEDFDVFIMGSGGAGCVAAARLRALGLSVGIGDEAQFPGGLLTGGLGIPDYVGIGPNSDTLSGYGRQFFYDCEVAAIADGAVVGSPANDTTTPPTPAVYGYGRYQDLPRRYAPEWGRYARDRLLAGTSKYWDIEIAGFEVDQFKKLGTIVTLTDGRQIRAKSFLSCSYEGTLSRAARVPMTYGRSENRATYNEVLAGAYSNNAAFGTSAILTARNDIARGYQGFIPQKPGEADLGIQGYNFRMTLSQHANRLPFQPPPGFREADFDDWIARAQGFTSIENIASGQYMSSVLLTTNGGDQWGFPREYPRCRNKAERRAFWARVYYNMAGWYYLAQNSPRMPQALRDNMALWGLPHDHNVTEFYGQRGWSAHMYIREAHRMRGQYMMDFADMGSAARLSVKEKMGRGGYHADSHVVVYPHLPGGGYMRDGDMLDQVQDGRGYWSIPFGSLKPPAGVIRNLLEVGCPSVTRNVMCSLRMEPTWMSIGEAAAIATYVAIRDNVPVTEVSYARVFEIISNLGLKV